MKIQPIWQTPNKFDRAKRSAGVAMAGCLLFVMLVAAVTASTQLAGVVELRIAQAAEGRAQAFVAAELGIADALRHATLSAACTPANPCIQNEPSTSPLEGTEATFSYRLYMVARRPAPEDPAAQDVHFFIESVGRATSGATDSLTQGFYIRRHSKWSGDTGPAPCSQPVCAEGVAGGPVRTFWRQDAAE
jgi:hypothetical protein